MSSGAGEGTSTSTTPSKEQMDSKMEALNMLAQGKRNLICGEVPTAVQQFQEACQTLSATFGEMARECAEAYFQYGSALLDLSRMEQDVLGNALEGVDVDADDEEGSSNKEQFEATEKLGDEERMKLRMEVVAAMSEDEISNQATLAEGKKTGEDSVSGETSFKAALQKAAANLVETKSPPEESSHKKCEDLKESSKTDSNETNKKGSDNQTDEAKDEQKDKKIVTDEKMDEENGKDQKDNKVISDEEMEEENGEEKKDAKIDGEKIDKENEVQKDDKKKSEEENGEMRKDDKIIDEKKVDEVDGNQKDVKVVDEKIEVDGKVSKNVDEKVTDEKIEIDGKDSKKVDGKVIDEKIEIDGEDGKKVDEKIEIDGEDSKKVDEKVIDEKIEIDGEDSKKADGKVIDEKIEIDGDQKDCSKEVNGKDRTKDSENGEKEVNKKEGKDEEIKDTTLEKDTESMEVEPQGKGEKGEKSGETGEKTDEEDKAKETEEGDEEEEEEDGEEEEEGEGESQEDGENKEGEDDADDVSNLQLSWEMLELSKIIYSKDPSKESQLKAAEACLKLGEVSLESEQYDQAIADLQACLKIQTEHLDSCDRAIAETYYQLGLACQMNKQLDIAKDSFKSAGACLEAKIEQLEIVVKEKPPKDPSKFVEPAEQAEKEIQEIKKILPEIQEKITETEEEGKEIENMKTMAKEAMGAIFSAVDSTTETGFGTSSSSPVKSAELQKTTNISHLIRKKRKPEDGETQGEDLESKKPKQDSSSGDATGNGMNGHAETKDDTSAAVTAT